MALTGYRNLTWLKTRLLPADMGEGAEYDADVEQIGKGVADLFDRFTGRTLRRTEDVIFETAADQESIVLTSYPVETLTAVSLVDGATVTSILTSVAGRHSKAGILRFAGIPGADYQLIRVTSTGGYWCEDEDAVMPVGAFPLPDEILNAWVQQCRAVCDAENTFRKKGAQAPDKKTGPGVETLALLPGVKSVLQLHLRIA